MPGKSPLQEPEAHTNKQSVQSEAFSPASASVAAAWHRLTPRSVLQLQRAAGNRFVTRLIQRRSDEDDKRSATGAVARGSLPETLRGGIEALSGVAMDGVRVHHNSSDAHKVNALAYAQGNDIHLAPGQEQHLAHEAWHVVQQRQGRVKPTGTVADGRALNDDPGLESEADRMGAKALQVGAVQREERTDETLQAKRSLLQRQESAESEDEELQMKRDPLQRTEADESEDEEG